MSKPIAVCVIIQSPTGKFLSVHTSKYGHGFPGGKIEENETVFEAGIREVKEETGISLNMRNLKFLGNRKDKTGSVSLLWYRELITAKPFYSKEGISSWVNKEDLISDSKFKAWNKWAFLQLESEKYE